MPDWKPGRCRSWLCRPDIVRAAPRYRTREIVGGAAIS